MRMLNDDEAYHVVSRVAFRKFVFDDEGKRKFIDVLRRQAAFSGVELLSFCVMSNHFHLLIRFRSQVLPESDAELIARYRRLYPRNEWISERTLSPDRLESILNEGGSEAVIARKRLCARMGSLAIFMKELKQRFTIWYNKNHDNVGTLWESTFRSQLIENSAKVLRMVAAYIELNPVRAGIVEHAEDYRWSSLGRAKMGDPQFKQILRTLWGIVDETFGFLNADQDWKVHRDLRLIRAGCLGSAEFVRRLCEKLLPHRKNKFRPVPWSGDTDVEMFTLRKIKRP
ncbi:MAG: transposase [Opitutales bacterium]